MPVESFKKALKELGAHPLLWLPGIVAGILAAGLWLMLNFSGAFFTSRLLIFASLILVAFIVGMLVLMKEKGGDIRVFAEGAVRYYFRVLLPQLVIFFMILVIFIILVVTFGFMGTASDPGFVALLTICVMIPTLILTFFFDTAAVFEDKKVFESIQRSTVLVSENVMDVIGFFVISIASSFIIIFGLMIAWEAALFERLAPLAEYNQTQIQGFTYGELTTLIGPDGIWVTAIVLFIGGVILIPLFYSYKVCFYQKLSGLTPSIQQMGGEYDSKGRWYKY